MGYSKEQLAENLRILRARRNLTRKEMAGSLGFSPEIVSKWEGARGGMTLESACKVADFYEVSLDEMVGRE